MMGKDRDSEGTKEKRKGKQAVKDEEERITQFGIASGTSFGAALLTHQRRAFTDAELPLVSIDLLVVRPPTCQRRWPRCLHNGGKGIRNNERTT